MKKLITILTVVTVFAAVSGVLYPRIASAGLFDDLMVYLAFDDQNDPTTDLSSNSNDGILGSNSATVENDDPFYECDPLDIAPPPGNVCSLDFTAAESDFVNIGGGVSLGSNDFTAAAWINTTMTGINKNVIIDKLGGSFNPGGTGGWALQVDTNLLDGTLADGALRVDFNSGIAVNNGAWRHVAIVRDGNVLRTYVDGAAGNTADTTGLGNIDENVGGRELHISHNNFNPLDGLIDEVYIFTRALSADEIATLAAGSSVFDACSDGLKTAGTDIKSVEVTSDGSVLTVAVTLCGAIDNKTKIRVHYDYEDPLFDVPGTADRNGDGFITAADVCATTSDDTEILARSGGGNDKITGPSTTATPIDIDMSDPNMPVLTYTVNYSDLDGSDSVALSTDDTVAVWVDAHDKGIADRAPDTDDSDGCSKPETANEVIEHMLN